MRILSSMSMFDDQGYDEGTYDILQACENGHLITERLQMHPERGQKHCHRCAAKTASECRSCGKSIRGHLNGAYVGGWEDEHVPAFCHECGTPYPWTARRIHAAQAMADEVEGLSDGDRIMLKSSIEEIVGDTPMSEVAVTRIKKIFKSVRADALPALRKLVVDVAGKAAAEMLKGG